MTNAQHCNQDASLDILETNIRNARLQQPLRFRCKFSVTGAGVGIPRKFAPDGTEGV